VLALVLLLAGPAAARPWDVQTLSMKGAAVSRAVDVLPNGHTALLVQRRVGQVTQLELRTGRRVRVLDRSSSGFAYAALRHDAHRRLIAIWVRPLDQATPTVFAWTTARGVQQVSGAGGAAAPDLAVAPGGRSALAYSTQDGVFVARGSITRGFTKTDRAGSQASNPGIAVTSGGRAVVAWSDGDGGILTRAASGSGPFGPMQDVQLRAPLQGATLSPGSPKVVMTGGGRAVICVSSDELVNRRVVDRRVEAFDWPARAAHPSGAATLSRGAAAGVADIVTQGTSAAIAWTQRSKGSPRALWVARWTVKGIQRPNLYDTRALGSPVLLSSAPSGALDLFYRAAGAHWFTVRLSQPGRFTGTSLVTPPGDAVHAIDVASAGNRVVAAWTSPGGRSRVQLATPAGS
jgi:hypothetical protein